MENVRLLGFFFILINWVKIWVKVERLYLSPALNKQKKELDPILGLGNFLVPRGWAIRA
jgi:hypothetical protein